MTADIRLQWEWPANRTADAHYLAKVTAIDKATKAFKIDSPSFANHLQDAVLLKALLINNESISPKTIELVLPRIELNNIQLHDTILLGIINFTFCIDIKLMKNSELHEKIGGWKIKSSHVAYENPWIKVSHDEVITPTGTDGIYGTVHFKNIAIGVVPIDEEANTWLVKQSRYTLNQYTWEIPEGGCPYGEQPVNAARRELEEEVGLKAAEITELMRMHLSNSVSDELAIIFIARGLSVGQQALESTEDIEYQKISLAAAIDMVKSGQITDSISVAALLRIALDFKN